VRVVILAVLVDLVVTDAINAHAYFLHAITKRLPIHRIQRLRRRIRRHQIGESVRPAPVPQAVAFDRDQGMDTDPLSGQPLIQLKDAAISGVQTPYRGRQQVVEDCLVPLRSRRRIAI
jgi:hypothetical protein